MDSVSLYWLSGCLKMCFPKNQSDLGNNNTANAPNTAPTPTANKATAVWLKKSTKNPKPVQQVTDFFKPSMFRFALDVIMMSAYTHQKGRLYTANVTPIHTVKKSTLATLIPLSKLSNPHSMTTHSKIQSIGGNNANFKKSNTLFFMNYLSFRLPENTIHSIAKRSKR